MRDPMRCCARSKASCAENFRSSSASIAGHQRDFLGRLCLDSLEPLFRLAPDTLAFGRDLRFRAGAQARNLALQASQPPINLGRPRLGILLHLGSFQNPLLYILRTLPEKTGGVLANQIAQT